MPEFLTEKERVVLELALNLLVEELPEELLEDEEFNISQDEIETLKTKLVG